MDNGEVLALLSRIDSIYRTNPRTPDVLGRVAAEWGRAIGFCSTARMNDALTVYIRENKGRFAPKPADLLAVYREISRQTPALVEDSEICPLCGEAINNGGKHFALVRAEEGDLWGVYDDIAIPCPCQRGELPALQRGLAVRRGFSKSRKGGSSVFVGELALRLVDERLVCRVVRGFKSGFDGVKEKEKAKQVESVTGNVKSVAQSIFDDLPF